MLFRSPPLDIPGILTIIAKAKYRSKIDIMDCYFSIRVTPESEKNNTFNTPIGTFASKVMLQGDKNAPATCNKLMQYILGVPLGKSVFVYFDDILVYNDDVEEHKADVRKVIELLR